MFIISCRHSKSKEYKGYMYYDKIPLSEVKILEEGTDNFTYTNHSGYFILKRSDKNYINDLVIYRHNSIDTLDVERGRASIGSGSYYLFLEPFRKIDTVDLHWENKIKSKNY
ncbi:hypothetical protein SAMN04488018_10355 [Myroides marinus]|uniref:Uncharacterized protein n=1 Tax=Myroides marinus TaxID=703342 RepID=A0A1H6SL40_9FLAO|nr:hypothetical protein [Myroides marinus]SEI68633.1 hypothetical protein SAMN04488018_10355 [Myroides marinus]